MGHEYANTWIRWIAVYVDDNRFIYFDSFGVEHISKEIREFIGDENIIANYRITEYKHITL